MESTQKVVVIMGPTGSGKTKLSIELASRFNGEIINADKIQFYKGLDITTNKVSLEDQLGVPHHLLAEFDSEVDLAQFRSLAAHLITQITSRSCLPILVGGSNSFLYALLVSRFHSNVFSRPDSMISKELRYNCCILCMDVSPPVLNSYLDKRVDQMIDLGLEKEMSEFYELHINQWAMDSGIRKAIGVPEFETYFGYKPKNGDDQLHKVALFEEAVKDMKDNTRQLAKRQMEKIQRLRMGGWKMHMLNGTSTFRAVLEEKEWLDAWQKDILKPSLEIVKAFLCAQP